MDLGKIDEGNDVIYSYIYIFMPLMTQEEISFYIERPSKADAYPQFGTGGSMAFATSFSNLHCLKCIENSQEQICSVSNFEASAAIASWRRSPP